MKSLKIVNLFFDIDLVNFGGVAKQDFNSVYRAG
jgi:hypothetical protein